MMLLRLILVQVKFSDLMRQLGGGSRNNPIRVQAICRQG
jgi:hypothetical protein